MNQEVIQDFLNLPGIVGIALLSGHSEPVFYSRDSMLAIGRTELLEGILQVVETIPAEYEVLEFRFSQYQIVLRRVFQGSIVLLIKNESCSDEQIDQAFQALRSQLERSIIDQHLPKLQDLLNAFNQLNQFTTKYLGIAVIVNYLKSSRPAVEWLEQFQIARSGQISFTGELSELEQAVSAQEHEWFRNWVAQFIRRCSQAVRDYAVLIEEQALTDTQKALLLP